MNFRHLIFKNLTGRAYRSAWVAGSILLLAAFLTSATLLSRSITQSLETGKERLGADIVVVPSGREKEAQKALLLGKPVSQAWMPAENLGRISRVEGVAQASPQLYLETLTGASCCSSWDMFMIAFDPETDFTITPWLKEKMKAPLASGDVIGGDWISVPPAGEEIRIYGSRVNLRGKLESTGMGLDRTLFLTLETAREIAGKSASSAEKPLVIPEGKISAVQVKVKRNESIDEVAGRIMAGVPGTYAFASRELTRVVQRQTEGLFRILFLGLALVWAMAVVLSGSVFSLMVDERRREIGFLRAVGASRNFIFRLFLAEGFVLGLAGGLAGISLAALSVHLFRFYLMRAAAVPLIFPPAGSLAGILAGCLALSLALSLPALLYPAFRASRTDPAESMREG